MVNNKINSLIRIDSRNDPLLHDKRFRLEINNKTLNVYKILSAYKNNLSDLTKMYKLEPKCKNTIMNLLLKRFSTIDEAAEALLRQLEFYRNENYSSKIKEKSRIKHNLITGNITLEYARMISIIVAKDLEESISIFEKLLLEPEFLVIHERKVRIPTNPKAVAYLAGVVCGDGHISKNLTEIIVVDGHSKEKNLIYSYRFLSNIKNIIMKDFSLNSTLEREDNSWRLRCSSALLCRIMNYIYEIPEGNKCNKIKVPNVIKNTDVENLFWRGMFDTDGCIRPKNKCIKLVTTSKNLELDFIDFCKRKNLTALSDVRKEHNRKTRYDLKIVEEDFLKFAKLVGISHPRKQNNLIEHLKNGAHYKIAISKIPNKKFENIIDYLRPYNESVYVKLTRRREKVNKAEFKQRVNLIEGILKVKVTKVRKPLRANDHYYICSKSLVKEINNHYDFVLPWKSLENEEINRLKENWMIR